MLESRLREQPSTFRVLSPQSNPVSSELSAVKTSIIASMNDRYIAVAPKGVSAGTFVIAATVSKH
jgi:hypothetical protein